MKVRESGMPPAASWDAFFDVEQILDRFAIDSSVADVVEFGTGYGTFSVPVAKRIGGVLHTLDIDADMLAAARCRARDAGVRNISFQLRDFIADGTGLADHSVDLALLCNILHGDEPVALLCEARRNLRKGGRLAIMHWNYDPDTPRGPPMVMRPKPQQCRDWARDAGFTPMGGTIDLPPYHYGVLMGCQRFVS